MADPLAARRSEQQRLLDLAREHVGSLARRWQIEAAVVVGSVARGDFNVWSDVDLVLIVEGLPERVPDRMTALFEGKPPRVQPVGFSKEEFARALRKRNPLAVEAVEHGIVLVGEDVLRTLAAA